MGLKDDLEKRRNDAQSSVLHEQDKLAVWQKTTAVLFDRVRELLADSISDGYLKPHTTAVRLYDYSAQQGYEIEQLTLKCSTGSILFIPDEGQAVGIGGRVKVEAPGRAEQYVLIWVGGNGTTDQQWEIIARDRGGKLGIRKSLSKQNLEDAVRVLLGLADS
jgi:hypothetical protein